MSDAAPRTKADAKLAREARDWVVRLASGEVAPAELQRFRAWKAQSEAHARAFAGERRFWQQLDGLGEMAGPVPPVAKPAAPRIGRRGFLAGGIAAGAGAWALDLPHRWQDWTADLHTGFGEMAGMTLPDGTIATLNTDSALALEFSRGQRQVRLLRGEAEFRVQAGTSPLRVAALDGVTEAQASVFSVGLADREARVTVSEGQVRVSPALGQPLDLGASEQAVYGMGLAVAALGPVDREIAFAWREGRIIFDGRRFDQAVSELARYVPEKVVLGPGVDSALPVSAVFSTSAAHEAIGALALTQGLSVRRIPQVMILLS